MESYITDTQLVEGLCAASVWAIFFVFMRNKLNISVLKEGALAWLGVWVVRKFGLTLYLSLKRKYHWPSFKLKLLPFPMVELETDKYENMELSEKIKILLIIIFWGISIWALDHILFNKKG